MRSFIVTFIVYAPTTDELLYPSPTSIQTVQRPPHLELSNLISSVACFGEKSCPKDLELSNLISSVACFGEKSRVYVTRCAVRRKTLHMFSLF